MITALDLGYNATKYEHEKRHDQFPSAVGTPDRAQFSLNGSGNGIILTEPFNLLVGEEAVTQSRFLNRREDRRWIESDDWLALVYAALTEITTAHFAQFDIVTGLPVAFYDDKQTIIDRLTGEHRIRREGRDAQTLRVNNVRVIPQPFGTLLAQVLDARGQIVDAQLARGTTGVIDVGGKTCNLLSATKLTEISRETASVNVGGWTLVRSVRQWLSTNAPGLDDLRDHQIAAAIQAREIRAYGQPVAEFPAVVDALAEDLAGQIVAEATQLWNGGAILDAILITGGGALLLGDHIRNHWPHAQVVADPVYANVTGYYRLAQRLYSKQ